MKLKKIEIVKFDSEIELILKVINDFNKEKNILISGGDTFDFFLEY